MLIVLSPAKTLDFSTPVPREERTSLLFENRVEKIAGVLAAKKASEIQKMMKLSDKLTELNYERYQNFTMPSPGDDSRSAIFAFKGEVYQGLDAYTLSSKALDRARNQIRILSGLYGILRPFDAIQPYRLEMGTALKVGRDKDLYAFWKKTLTEQINRDTEAAGSDLLLNLASNEYFSALDAKKIKARIVEPTFKDFKNGKLKTISFFLKKARGMMARYVVENDIQSANDVLGFNMDGYTWSPEHSTENSPVFIR